MASKLPVAKRELGEISLTKEECQQQAVEDKRLAEQLRRAGHIAEAERAIKRALEWEKQRDSWLYRMFGW